jgi:nucleoside-diphosphate-sugar epimerase
VKVLVTGAAGFIGRHFLRAVSIDPRWTLVVANDIRTVPGLSGPPSPPGDCRTLFARDMGDDLTFDLVIHCAAMVGGRAKIDGDPLAVAQNLAIDSDLFRWAIRGNARRIIYFSSSAAYPTSFQRRPGHALSEDDIRFDEHGGFGTPDQTYGWAKLTGEMLARYAEAEGVRVHVFRPFSGYGSDQDADYPFPAFVDRAFRREDPFEVWGTGTQARDFIHVDDIVNAVFAAVDQDYPGPLNLCTGRPTEFTHLADMVTFAAGYRPDIVPLPDKPVGVHWRVGDPTNMLKVWTPRVSLEEGILRALADRH